MKFDWTLSMGTLVHLFVLMGGIIGVYWRLRANLDILQAELKQFAVDRDEIKNAVEDMRECITEVRIKQAESSASLKDLILRMNHRT